MSNYDLLYHYPLAHYDIKTRPSIGCYDTFFERLFGDYADPFSQENWERYYEDLEKMSRAAPDSLFIVSIRPFARDRRSLYVWFDETTRHIWKNGVLEDRWTSHERGAVPPPIPDRLVRAIDPLREEEGPLLADFIEDLERGVRLFRHDWLKNQKEAPEGEHWPDRMSWSDWTEQFLNYYQGLPTDNPDPKNPDPKED